MTEPLKKVDSAVQGLGTSPPKDSKVEKVLDSKRRQSSVGAPGVYNIKDLGEQRPLYSAVLPLNR
jgi:hypothetical protein